MSAYLMGRSRVIYGNQQKRCRQQTGESLPYSLDELRREVILPRVNEPRCVYCNLIVISESSFQIDHIVPIVRGGSWALANLILCCPSCNLIKGALTSEEYAQLQQLVSSFDPYAEKDLYRRIKIGSNPMAARLISGR